VNQKDRIKALIEARKVLKKNGILFAAAINRFASLFDQIRKEGAALEFKELVEYVLKTGKHLPKSHKYFTNAYFHTLDELSLEIKKVDFELDGIFGVEGPGFLMPDSEIARFWQDKNLRELLLYVARITEQEPTLSGTSAHLLAVAFKR